VDNLIDFDDLKPGNKAVKKIVQAFTRAGAPVVSTDVDGKTKRSSGVSFRSLFLTFADGQKVEFQIKAPGDIFAVKINGSLQPMKAQSDQKKAVAELVGYLEAGRAKHQAKLARIKAELPKGIRTAAPRMEVALKTRTEYLDGEIAKAKTTIRTLKEELGEAVMDAVKSALMAFNVDSALGKFTAIVKVEAGMSDKDAKSDAIELAQSELGGRSARVLGSGKKLSKLPDDSWESKKARGWGWLAKGYLVPVMDSADPEADSDNEQDDADLTGNLFAMDSTELAEAIELAKIVNGGAVLDSASMDHAVATLKVALDTVQHNLPITEAEGNADQAALQRETIESIQAALDCLCGQNVAANDVTVSITSQTGPSKAVHQYTTGVGQAEMPHHVDVPDDSNGAANPALDQAGGPAFINPFRK
jgi:hypothetical protein